MLWRAGRHEFHFPRPTLVMGVLNVTPDSFSDGGRFLDPKAALAQGRALLAQGADLIDVKCGFEYGSSGYLFNHVSSNNRTSAGFTPSPHVSK